MAGPPSGHCLGTPAKVLSWVPVSWWACGWGRRQEPVPPGLESGCVWLRGRLPLAPPAVLGSRFPSTVSSLEESQPVHGVGPASITGSTRSRGCPALVRA